MTTITIKDLDHFNPEDLLRIKPGYTATEKYAVTRVEGPDCTTISVALTPLAEPYVKQWDYDEAELDNYAHLVEEEHLSLAAYDGNEIVGMAIVEVHEWNKSLWVWELQIKNGYRGQGIGRQMADRLAEKGRALGLRIMVCEAQNTNVRAIAFYRKAGFTLEGIDLSYYSNDDVTDGEVAIFMKRRL